MALNYNHSQLTKLDKKLKTLLQRPQYSKWKNEDEFAIISHFATANIGNDWEHIRDNSRKLIAGYMGFLVETFSRQKLPSGYRNMIIDFMNDV
jgi:hypothetical protein